LHELWYTRTELAIIKKEVGRVLMEHVVHKRTSSKASDRTCIPELWGLERHNLERAQAKKAAVKLIVMAQHLHGLKGDPERLRAISYEATKTARGFAQDQGIRDASQYEVDSAESVVDGCISDVVLAASYDFSSQCHKRSLLLKDGVTHHERRVRQRFSRI